jgi:outer membrane protein OmpA-like peptidoglycan-associated protein
LAAVALAAAAALSVPAWAQTRDLQGEQRTADDLAKNYSKEAMEQALQTKQRFDLYGLHFESEQSAINADGKSLLDDIATALKNFPDWGLRIGPLDATPDPQHNEALSLTAPARSRRR